MKIQFYGSLKFSAAAMLTAMALTFTGCAYKSGSEALGKTDTKQVGNVVKKNKTTKKEIKEMFGEPDKIVSGNGPEVWIYAHSKREENALNYIPFVNLIASGSNDTSKSLVIKFNSNGTVQSYTADTTKSEAKTSLDFF